MVVRYKWDGDDPRIVAMQSEVAAARQRAVEHPLYASLTSMARVRSFMTVHAFAVWDFMSLLTSLQRRLTCVEVPWRPLGNGLCRRLINDIVLVEESDEVGERYMSHFELYLRAIEQAGADSGPLRRFLGELEAGSDVPEALSRTGVPAPADQFVRTTWDIVASGRTHEVAAVFAFGRESLIPAMFSHVLEGDHCVPLLRDYLERHVEVDEEEHTPMAVQMVIELCGDDDQRWADARRAVVAAVDARRRLWDGILAALPPEDDHGERQDGPIKTHRVAV